MLKATGLLFCPGIINPHNLSPSLPSRLLIFWRASLLAAGQLLEQKL